MKKIIFIASLVCCSLPLFAQVLFQESFDNTIFPPDGWLNKRVVPSFSNTNDLWERVSLSNNPVISTHSGNGMAFFNSYSFPGGTKTELVTPPLNLPADGTSTLKFWMYRDGNVSYNSDLVEVYVNTQQGAGGSLLTIVPRSSQQNPVVSTSGWYQYSAVIPSTYNGSICYIIFRGIGATGNNITIDDIEVFGPSQVSCNYPINLSLNTVNTTSGTISWAAQQQSNPDGYEWEVRTAGPGGSGSTGLVNSVSVISANAAITNLVANTSYSFYVRSTCGLAKSIWVGPFNFKTACSVNNIPFSENFDAVSAPNLPNCFTVENRNSGNTWVNTYLGSSSFSPYSSPNAIVYASQTSVAGDDWLYTPALNLKAGVNYRMQFWYKSLFAGFANKVEVKFGKAPNAVAMNSTVIYSNNNIGNTPFQQASFGFTVQDSGINYIGIHCITPTGAFNYQMLLDNIFIDIGPDPNCGVIRNLRVDTAGITTAIVKWITPSSGIPVTYDWEIRTSGLPGSGQTGRYASGQIPANDSIVLSGLNMGSNYTFYIKTNCTSPTYGLWSTGVNFTTQTTACGAITGIKNITRKDGFSASWVAPAISSLPVLYDWEVRTSGNAGSGVAGLVSSGSTTNLFTEITGLMPLTDYSFYVRARCISGNNSIWAGKAISTTIENDVCADAIELTVGKGFNTNPKAVLLSSATPSSNLPNSCALINNGSGNTNSMQDAWYKVVIPPTGNVIVQTHSVLKSNLFNFDVSFNNMLIAYTGECGNLTEIACDRDGAPNDNWGVFTYNAKIVFTGRTPGEIIYLRLLPDGYNSPYVFFYTDRAGIAAWDTTTSVLPAVSQGGICRSNVSINVGAIINTDNYFIWNPVFDSEGRIVAEVCPNNAVGTLTTSTFVDTAATVRRSSNNRSLLSRNLSIAVQNSSFSRNPYVRIYYKKEELAKLKAINPIAEYDFLEIIKTSGLCNNGVITGQETIISPTSFGKFGDDYYVETEVSSLGNFYLTPSTAVSKGCVGDTTSFTSNVGTGNFQWQVNAGGGFTNIANDGNYTGATAKTLKLSNIPSQWYGYQYRCISDTYYQSKPFKLQLVNTWTGLVDNKWENTGNWSCGVLPDSNVDVVINAGNILIESNTATCKSLNTKSGVQITIASGGNLNVIH